MKFYIFLCILMLSLIYANDQLGPADITIERVEECEDPEKYPLKIIVDMNKINRTHAGFTTCVDLLDDLDQTTFINLTAAKWGDGGWKPNALNFFEADVCKVLNKYVNKAWTGILNVLGVENKCPFPKGNYCLNKIPLELEGLFPSMLYGKFKITAFFIWGTETKACIRAYVNSVRSKGGIKF